MNMYNLESFEVISNVELNEINGGGPVTWAKYTAAIWGAMYIGGRAIGEFIYNVTH